MAIKSKDGVELDVQKIESDLRKFTDIYCQEFARQGSIMISEFAFKEMLGYYGEYDPRLYVRTNNMLLFSHLPYQEKRGNIYMGGVDISSNNTSSNDFSHIRGSENFTEDDLYNMVWIQGYHGYEKVGYPNSHLVPIIGKADRLQNLKNKAYSKTTKEKASRKGMKAALDARNGYSILKF